MSVCDDFECCVVVGVDCELHVHVGFVRLRFGLECEMCLLVEHCMRCVWVLALSVPIVVGDWF